MQPFFCKWMLSYRGPTLHFVIKEQSIFMNIIVMPEMSGEKMKKNINNNKRLINNNKNRTSRLTPKQLISRLMDKEGAALKKTYLTPYPSIHSYNTYFSAVPLRLASCLSVSWSWASFSFRLSWTPFSSCRLVSTDAVWEWAPTWRGVWEERRERGERAEGRQRTGNWPFHQILCTF